MDESKSPDNSVSDELTRRRQIKQELREVVGQSERNPNKRKLCTRLTEKEEKEVFAPRMSLREKKTKELTVVKYQYVSAKEKKATKKKISDVKNNKPATKKTISDSDKKSLNIERAIVRTPFIMSLRDRNVDQKYIEDSSSEENSHDSVCYYAGNSAKSKTFDSSLKKTSSESSESEETEEGGLKISEYELQIQKNIQERKEMFKKLKLGDAKKGLAKVLKSKKRGN